MANLILDTHAAIHELINAGMPERQAETVVRQHVKLIEHNLATKSDLKDIITRIENLRQETIARIETAKVDIIKWIVAMNLGTASLIIAIIVAIIKLL